MDGIDYWRFCNELTVQAVLLIISQDPSKVAEDIDGFSPDQKPNGYIAVLSALQHSVASDQHTTKVFRNLDDKDPDADLPVNCVEWHSSRVDVDELKMWLDLRGVQSGFFLSRRSRNSGIPQRSKSVFRTKACCSRSSVESGAT